jgi:hypothetical protein
MSFAEIILRIGASIGGWLVFLGLCLTLAVIPEADCDPLSDQLWRGTLLFALLAGVGLVFAGQGLAWRAAIRWVALPSGALAVYCLWIVMPAIGATSLGRESLCAIAGTSAAAIGGHAASTIERIWPIALSGVLLAGLGQATRYWRPLEEDFGDSSTKPS